MRFSQIGIFSGGLLEAKIRRSFPIPALRLFHLPGGTGSQSVLGEAKRPPASRFTHKLGAMGSLGAHIFMLHLINFPVDKAVDAPPRIARRVFYRAGPFRGLLLRQLFPGRAPLAVKVLHALPGFAELFRFGGIAAASAGAAGGGPVRVRAGASAVMVEPVRGTGLLAILPELAPVGTLSRSGLRPAMLPVLWDTLSQTCPAAIRSSAALGLPGFPVSGWGLRPGISASGPGGLPSGRSLRRVRHIRGSALTHRGRLRLDGGLRHHAGRCLFPCPGGAAPGLGLRRFPFVKAQAGPGLIYVRAPPLTLQRHGSNPPGGW